ncbi:MAG: type IV pilus assembly protein PilM, partial [bacterium]
AQTVRDFFQKNNIMAKSVATSVSGNAVIVRYVKLSKLSKKELAFTLPVEAEPFIPFDIKEVDLGCHILGDVMEEGQKKMETVLVAAKKEIIKDRMDILSAAGLQPLIIDVDAFTLETVYEKNRGSQDADTLLFLNMGHRVTNLSILEKGVAKVVRDIFIAGVTMDKAIQKVLQSDLAEAEEAKKTKGVLISSEEKEAAIQADDREALGISKAASGVLRDLAGEISRSVDFYLSQGAEHSIGKILLSGGMANFRNISQFLSAEFKVPVEIMNPISFMENQGKDIPKEILPTLAVATGLALRQTGDWEQG